MNQGDTSMLAKKSRRPNILVTSILVLTCFQIGMAHKQPVHQYIAREGYELLRQAYGRDIPQLSAFIGLADPSYAGDSAWQKGFITTGAWREDEEDVVYHYDILPGLNYALTSITHFWDADQGDYTKSMFRLVYDRPPLPPIIVDIGPYQNAFDKFMQFAHGGWVLWYPRSILCQNTANNHFLSITPLVAGGGLGIPVAYNELTSLYTDRKLAIRSEAPAVCVVFDLNDLKTINLSDVAEIRVDDGVSNTIVWEVLGRMCHLLGDMSVPAHAHRDEHGLNPDSYEDYVGGAGDPYKVWDHTNAGEPIILNDSIHGTIDDDTILHFLMYDMQQQADHFGSNGPAQGNGNDNIGGNSTQAERNFLYNNNFTTLGGPTTDAGPWTVDNLNTIRDKTLPFAIRATAGLLYWFCHKIGIMDSLVTDAPDERMHGLLPVSASLSQNFPNPFNPETTIRYQVPANSNVRLSVYDIVGREIAVLVDEKQIAGSYTVHFNASGLASGAYFYRLQAGTPSTSSGPRAESRGFVETKKLLFLR